MSIVRKIERVLRSRPTVEGAGVHLKRGFGYHEVSLFDPFLLLDHFGSANPADYIPGFPWHPHRGIETVTYMIDGSVKHGDSIGNRGVINSGDVQWMTAGSGIVHEEMLQRWEGDMIGFQLWVNLPSSHKMMRPRYQDIKAGDIPQYTLENGVTVKVIAGTFNGKLGPVKDIISNPEYLDITIPSGRAFEHTIAEHHNLFAYIFEGTGFFDPAGNEEIAAEHVILYGSGEKIQIKAQDKVLRVLLISGKPIGEPVAWSGPIVMNTREELILAFEEYRNGTFIKD